MTSYALFYWGQLGDAGIFMNKDMCDSLDVDQQMLMGDVGADMVDEFGRLITVAIERR